MFSYITEIPTNRNPAMPDPINGWGAVFPANMPITIPTEFSQCATYMQQILYLMAYKQPKLINGANVSITDNPDGTQTISVAGEAEGIVTLRVNPAITLPAGSEPRVENVGTNSNVILQFYLPEGMQGEQGETGADAEVELGTVTTVPYDSPAYISNRGTPGHAIFDFSIPRGAPGADGSDGQNGENATIAIGATITGEPGTAAAVRNVGTPTNAILSFTIPEGRAGRDGSNGRDGIDGTAATVTVGTVTSTPYGNPPQVINSGTPQNAVLNFVLETGEKGDTGERGERGLPGADGRDGVDGQNGADGQAATVTIGTVTTLPAGSNATVTNVGTSTDAVLNIGIPKGADGSDGQGIAATIQVGTVTSGNAPAVVNVGTEQHAVFNFTLQKGDTGDTGAAGADGRDGVSPTVTVGSVTTLPAGSNATVTNVGSGSNIVLDFGIPVGATGAAGQNGQNGQDGADGQNGADGVSPIVNVGTVTTGAPGSAASVINSGTASNIVLDFTIPQGPVGPQGPTAPLPVDVCLGKVGSVNLNGLAGISSISRFIVDRVNLGVSETIFAVATDLSSNVKYIRMVDYPNISPSIKLTATSNVMAARTFSINFAGALDKHPVYRTDVDEIPIVGEFVYQKTFIGKLINNTQGRTYPASLAVFYYSTYDNTDFTNGGTATIKLMQEADISISSGDSIEFALW